MTKKEIKAADTKVLEQALKALDKEMASMEKEINKKALLQGMIDDELYNRDRS